LTPTPADRYIPLAVKERCPKVLRPPVALALVIDSSSSMTGPTRHGRSKLDAAIEAALVPVGMLEPSDLMAIASFDGAARTLSPLTSDLGTLRRALDSVEAGRGSRLDAGIRVGAESLDRAPLDYERHLVVLTDGLPNPSSPDDAVLQAETARARGITISAIGLGPDVDSKLLMRIAADPKRYYEAPDAEDLPQVFGALTWRPPPCGGTPMWPRR
jgi:Mg-chelatase subunit ChlD